MTDKNTQELISLIVDRFYEKAVKDFLIGYHFRKIQKGVSLHPLEPTLQAFAHHLPRIKIFWEIQLGVAQSQQREVFDLIHIHKRLGVRKGEVGRWCQLFTETLKEFENQENQAVITDWRLKIEHFEKIFLNHPTLFSKDD